MDDPHGNKVGVFHLLADWELNRPNGSTSGRCLFWKNMRIMSPASLQYPLPFDQLVDVDLGEFVDKAVAPNRLLRNFLVSGSPK